MYPIDIKEYDLENITSILSNNNIKYRSPKGDWLEILCPLSSHPGVDTNFGNCSVNVKSGVINCFACGSGHISFFDNSKDFFKKSTLNNNINLNLENKIKEKVNFLNEFVVTDINPDKYVYTLSRGFTKDFCEKFNIKLGLSGFIDDYMIIPVTDFKQGINTYEFRKIKEYEVLQKFYKDENLSYSELRNKYKGSEFYKIKKTNDRIIHYLNKPKVLYPPHSLISNTLFNIDNLNYNETLYLVEGIGSIPKIYENITNNVSCIFGVQLSDNQINYLKKFKKIICVVDPDGAGYDLMCRLYHKLDNLSVIHIEDEDTSDSYINNILNSEILDVNKFLIKYYFKYNYTNKRS